MAMVTYNPGGRLPSITVPGSKSSLFARLPGPELPSFSQIVASLGHPPSVSTQVPPANLSQVDDRTVAALLGLKSFLLDSKAAFPVLDLLDQGLSGLDGVNASEFVSSSRFEEWILSIPDSRFNSLIVELSAFIDQLTLLQNVKANLLVKNDLPCQHKQNKIVKKRGRKSLPPGGICHHCHLEITPEWRNGPEGKRTLCNACGLFYSKLIKRFGPDSANKVFAHRKINSDTKNRILPKSKSLEDILKNMQ